MLSITKTRLFKYIENFTTKNWVFNIKILIFFYISAQNVDCGYPQSMFLSRNKKNNVYPCKPQFYYIKVGLKRVKIIQVCFRDDFLQKLNLNKCWKSFRCLLVFHNRLIISWMTSPTHYFTQKDEFFRGEKTYMPKQNISRVMRKCVFSHMRRAKVKVTLHIHVVWSGPSLSTNRIIDYYTSRKHAYIILTPLNPTFI